MPMRWRQEEAAGRREEGVRREGGGREGETARRLWGDLPSPRMQGVHSSCEMHHMKGGCMEQYSAMRMDAMYLWGENGSRFVVGRRNRDRRPLFESGRLSRLSSSSSFFFI